MKDIKQEQIDRIAEIARTDDSSDAPDFAIKYAKNLFLSRAASPASSLIRRIVAVLTAEIAAGVPAFGERSASASSERQLLFQAGEIGIDLRISGSGSARTIRGQILGSDEQALDVRLSTVGGEEIAAVSEFNSFAFDGVAARVTSLTIRFEQSEVAIEIPNE